MKKSNVFKRSVSLLLLIVIILTMVPSFAFAKDSDEQMDGVEEALNKVLQYYKDNPPSNPDSDWESFVGLWGAGVNLDPNKYDWNPMFEKTIISNEHIRYIFSLLPIGVDPTSFIDRNLFQELLAHPMEVEAKWGSTYKNAFGTIGKHIFAIQALDIGEALGLDVGNWNADSKDDAIEWLLNQQDSEGAFGQLNKLDHTGWALIVLSQYREQQRVQKAIDKALEYIKSKQNDKGSFVDTDMWGTGENSNTNACVIQGLVALGEDIADPNGKWAKDGKTPIDGLLQFQQEDGSFWWEKNNPGNITMATKQSLIALVDLVNNKSTWHRMKNEIKLPQLEKNRVDELNKLIPQLPSVNNVTLNNKQQIMRLYNMFIQLPDEQKNEVENRHVLIGLKGKIDTIEKEISELNEAIWKLPGDINKITLKHKPTILDIMARYDALNDEDKKHVEYYDEVLEAMAMIEKLEQENPADKPGHNKDTDKSMHQNLAKNENNNIGKNIKKDIIEDTDSKTKPIMDTNKNPKTEDHRIVIILLLFILSVSTLTIMGIVGKPSRGK
ncbi:MAG TPA: hypothetical protein GXX70_06755 [Tepidimicrobium sp.]|nr:hypothetical protein [Tepidimicrobium sp.]